MNYSNWDEIHVAHKKLLANQWLRDREALQATVAYCAIDWWKGYRPVRFSILEHIQNPTVNIPRSTAMELAMLVSMHVARRGFEVRFKRIRKTKQWQRFVPIWRRSWSGDFDRKAASRGGKK